MSEEKALYVPLNSPVAMMEKALSAGAGLEQLEKMMVLQAQWEEREAKKAYVVAMAKFKANPPDIEKDRRVSYTTKNSGKTEYNHATLANVTQKINSALSEYGLSAAWTTKQDNGLIAVTCTITHEMGHSESTSLSAKPDETGGKNSIQAIGSTVSYLERYTILALTGLATREQDDDGRSAGKQPEYVTDKQLSQIIDLINSKGVDEDAFHKYMGVSSSEEILGKDFGKALTALTKAKGTSK